MLPKLKHFTNLLVLCLFIFSTVPGKASSQIESSVHEQVLTPTLQNKIGDTTAQPYFLYIPYITNGLKLPVVFNKVTPANGAASQPTSLTVDWADSSGATSYAYCYDTTNDNACLNWNSTGTTSQAAISGLSASTTYYWQVKATDGTGDTFANEIPTAFWSFTTGSTGILPGAFNKVSPANGAASQPTSLTVDWADSSGATSYAYCYDTTNDNACLNWNSTGTTSQAAISGLSASTTYYWQVKATDGTGDTFANEIPTAFWSFTTGSGSVIPGEMMTIPAGSFQMGCDPAHNGGYLCPFAKLPLHTVTLDAYRIDKYEVTNAQYAQCVAARNCAAPSENSSSTRPSYYNNPTYASYPVVYVSWQDAANYCTWAGKRLPSEAEWEKAARGPTLITYPWGDQAPTCALGNFYVNGDCVGDTSAVGSYPAGASPYGVMDMAGNAWEWVNDWYSRTYYSSSPASNPPGPASGTYKVLRGGSWGSVNDFLRVAYRNYEFLTSREYVIGFRCAAPPGN